MDNLRIFLVGAGHIARAHANTALKLAIIYDLNLEIHVADPVEAARLGFAESFPNATLYESPAEMLTLAATKNDIAIIATPPFLHREGAIAALESGRHTLVEKPLTLDLGEAQEIAEVAARTGLIFGDCSTRLYDMPSNRALKTRLEAGEIGAPYHVTHVHKGNRGRPGIEYQPQSKWFLDKSKAGGGILVDWAVYDLANLTFLLEPVKVEVRAAWWATPQTEIDPTDVVFDVETHAGAAMIWHQNNGNRVFIDYERASGTHGEARNFSEIEGTKGSYQWDWAWDATAKGTHRYDRAGKLEVEPLEFVNAWEAEHELDQGNRPLVAFYRHAIRGEDVPILTGRDSLFNFRVLRAIFEAAETGAVQIVEK